MILGPNGKPVYGNRKLGIIIQIIDLPAGEMKAKVHTGKFELDEKSPRAVDSLMSKVGMYIKDFLRQNLDKEPKTD